MNVTPTNIVLPQRTDASDTSYRMMSARAMILEIQRSMKQLYDTYVVCHAQLEQNVVQLQKSAFTQAMEAKDKRRDAEYISGAVGIFAGVAGLALGGGGGIWGSRTTNLNFATGVEIGSHLSTPTTTMLSNAGQMGAAAKRNEAEEEQIHSDLSRNVSESAERDASKAQDNAAQHRQQYLQDANQLTQESVAILKATVAPR
ncbi:hypothetical protein [Cupriavidus gilardii]|uniref:hypothetical protein n=1 Tax=Cupriavidus gilardii TaxID=82541 RepID=UPI001574A5D0|nr:hypothetical protein [Cupriavidus gilardii]NSX05749.1 hypothetical protein [Cupriavidus gilardii]